jgi:hypothetical protein
VESRPKSQSKAAQKKDGPKGNPSCLSTTTIRKRREMGGGKAEEKKAGDTLSFFSTTIREQTRADMLQNIPFWQRKRWANIFPRRHVSTTTAQQRINAS